MPTGIGIGLSPALGGATPALLNPATLSPFWWFDFSTPATLFQDAAGTNPVTANGQTISRANDKSAFGRNLTHAIGGTDPTWNSAGINGKGACDFNGAMRLAGPDFTAQAVAQPYAVALAFRLRSVTGTRRAIDSQAAGRYLFGSSAGAYQLFAGSSVTGGAADTALHAAVAVYNGAASSLQIDGGLVLSAVNAGANTAGGLVVGADSAGGSPADVLLGEAFAWANPTAPQVAAVLALFRSKWGTP